MRAFWLCWLLWESLISVDCYPVSSPTESDKFFNLKNLEINWINYSIGLVGIALTVFTLIGCLCCKKNRRPKGFQDVCSGSIDKEFKDGSMENDLPVPQMLQGLELQVPTPLSTDRIQFEPLPVERFIPENNVTFTIPKPPPASPSIFDEDNESDQSTLQDSCQEWFQNTDLHIPREKLKYLREIGHGWFGKVVEGCADVENLKAKNFKSGNIVVRILTEEATAKEKAWFLGEATPYFKLRHRNILSLFGSCLENDPYLLLFEHCPLGDLKGFLQSNRDPRSQLILIKENMPTRIAIEIGAGLRHMHEHKLAHTDLSARNCLVASDLSIKLGDYGTGVEKYPGDYYILGDRALPIRWSAPESVECTETTIETKEITPRANLWSYGVLLWEIAKWGERPYDEIGDEQVIKMLLSSKSGLKSTGSQLLLQSCDETCASNLLEAIKCCLILEPMDRLSLEQIRHILLKDQLEAETSDFEQRWENLRPNIIKEQVKSASLQNLRGSLDSEQWPSLLQTSFRLGPEEPVKNVPGSIRTRLPFRDSDSETEEESWRARVERGVYTEKVKQKSKSVADLMILVHIEPDSDADLSLGPPISFDKKKRYAVTGSDGDLPSIVIADEFDLALRQLRDPSILGNSLRGVKLRSDTFERPKLTSLVLNQQTNSIFSKQKVKDIGEITSIQTNMPNIRKEDLKLTKSAQSDSLTYGNSIMQASNNFNKKFYDKQSCASNCTHDVPCYSNNFQITDLDDDDDLTNKNLSETQNHSLDIAQWNQSLNSALEQKINNINKETEFHSYLNHSPSNSKINSDAITPSPQSHRGEYSGDDLDDEFSNADEFPKKYYDDDRKRMSTPDDERSSDSGFRDKESCEEEESPLAGPLPNLTLSQSNTPKITRHDIEEDEPLRVLLELDTILDAECGEILDSLDPNVNLISNYTLKENEPEESETVQSLSETSIATEKENPVEIRDSIDIINSNNNDKIIFKDKENNKDSSIQYPELVNLDDIHIKTIENWPAMGEKENDDDDSSTVSLRSDNSYVSFNMDEEFVAAIRNELKEKLPHAQMSVIEVQEPCDDDEPSINSDVDNKNWEDDDYLDDMSDRTGTIDISIRYNSYGTPLSPILEERESVTNSESIIYKDDSRDASIASKEVSISEEDVLYIDTQTNTATLVSLDNKSICENNKLTVALDNSPSKFINSSNSVAPLPSPEEESKWQQTTQYPLPQQIQNNLMSTSFLINSEYGSKESKIDENTEIQNDDKRENDYEIDEEDDEDSNDSNENDDDDDDDEDDDEDEDEDDGENGIVEEDEDEDSSSSSSGEFVWKNYATTHIENRGNEDFIKERRSSANSEEDDDEEADEDEEDEEEEFTPSAWDATLAPHRSALRSPEKTLKTGDQKKSVWFKKQRYHCVYEYPKETPPAEQQSPATPSWEPTNYTDWEEMINDIDRINFQPSDYFENNSTSGGEEFFVSSSNRPFQSKNGKYVSQFFPGAVSGSSQETENSNNKPESTNEDLQFTTKNEKPQLGELRHTRDKLKLNLTSANGAAGLNILSNSSKQGILLNKDENEDENKNEDENSKEDENKNSEKSIINNDANSHTDNNFLIESQKMSNKDSETLISSAVNKLSPSDGQKNIEENLIHDSNNHDLH